MIKCPDGSFISSAFQCADPYGLTIEANTGRRLQKKTGHKPRAKVTSAQRQVATVVFPLGNVSSSKTSWATAEGKLGQKLQLQSSLTTSFYVKTQDASKSKKRRLGASDATSATAVYVIENKGASAVAPSQVAAKFKTLLTSGDKDVKAMLSSVGTVDPKAGATVSLDNNAIAGATVNATTMGGTSGTGGTTATSGNPSTGGTGGNKTSGSSGPASGTYGNSGSGTSGTSGSGTSGTSGSGTSGTSGSGTSGSSDSRTSGTTAPAPLYAASVTGTISLQVSSCATFLADTTKASGAVANGVATAAGVSATYVTMGALSCARRLAAAARQLAAGSIAATYTINIPWSDTTTNVAALATKIQNANVTAVAAVIQNLIPGVTVTVSAFTAPTVVQYTTEKAAKLSCCGIRGLQTWILGFVALVSYFSPSRF